MKKRRSVEEDVQRFDGWEKIISLAKKLELARDRALYSATFLTGGRISEVLSLECDNFIVDEDFVCVRDMPLLKRYDKVGSWIERVDKPPDNVLRRLFVRDEKTGTWYRQRYNTKRKVERRPDFYFPRAEPLVPILIDWLDRVGSGRLFDIGRVRAWQIFNKIGIYPHWLRAQRASCLISFWGFTMEEMMEWMGWEELSTARRYGKMGGRRLAEKFRRVQIPRRIREMEADLVR